MTFRRPPPGSTLPESGTADGLASTELPTSRCLAIDELLALVQGDVSPSRRDRALEHIDACPDCQVLMAEAGAAMQSSSAQVVYRRRGVFDAGDRISNRYDVERFIAKGGMGEVYAVFDTLLGERVALKTVRGAAPDDSKAIRRLKSEVLLSRRIGHPNTCRIYEFGEHQLEEQEVVCYFTMALVNGETLGAKLRRDGPLATPEAATAARQILAGLAEAHGLGILHRDLKSDNIMLRSPPSPGLSIDAVIMDFGLALRLDGDERLTSDSNAIVGSLAYMAPEQVASEKLTPATDIYAFGVILFEMLTGRLPFRGATPAVVALQRLRQAPPAPSGVVSDLDPAWDRIVRGCLERSTEKRFASARQVLAALDTMSGVAPRRQRPWRRWALIAAGVLACAGLAAWGQWRWHAAQLGADGPAVDEAVDERAGAELPPNIGTATPALRAEPSVPPPIEAEPPAAPPPADPAPAPALEAERTSRKPSASPAPGARREPRSKPVITAPRATAEPSPVPAASPQRRQPVGPLPVDPEFPE